MKGCTRARGRASDFKLIINPTVRHEGPDSKMLVPTVHTGSLVVVFSFAMPLIPGTVGTPNMFVFDMPHAHTWPVAAIQGPIAAAFRSKAAALGTIVGAYKCHGAVKGHSHHD